MIEKRQMMMSKQQNESSSEDLMSLINTGLKNGNLNEDEVSLSGKQRMQATMSQ
jgi:hypothetical protein